MSEMVVMGRIVAPYGVLGWLKVIPDTESIDGLLDYPYWWVGKDNQWAKYQLKQAKVHNDILLVKLDGIDDRDAAFARKGQLISVPREQLPEAGEDEFYWSDLIGLQVKNQNGIVFGDIVEVFETGANDVIVVRPKSQNTDNVVKNAKQSIQDERLIPFVDGVILDVDLKQKTMLVDWDENF